MNQLTSISSNLLAGVYSIGLGFLSFAGAYLLLPSVPFAVASFFFVGAVCFDVVRIKINAGLTKLALKSALQEKQLVEDLMMEKTTQTKLAQQQLKDIKRYHRFKQIITQLEAIHCDAEQAKALADAKTQAELIINRWYLDYKSTKPSILNEDDLQKLAYAKKRGQFIRGIAKLVASMTAVCLFLTLISTIKGALATTGASFGFALGFTAVSSIVFSVAALAAIGYGLAIYHSICDFLGDTRVASLKQRVTRYFGLSSSTKKVALAVGIFIALLIMVAATVSTAGGWWFAAKATMDNWQPIKSFMTASWRAVVSRVIATAYSISYFFFGLNNALNSLRSGINNFKNPLVTFSLWAKKYKAAHGLIQLLNPIDWINRIIANFFRFFVFVGHLFSEAAANVREGGGNKYWQVTTSAGADALTDIETLQEPGFKQNGQDKPLRDMVDEHQPHTHGAIELLEKFVLVVCLFPLHIFSAVIRFVFDKKQPTFKQSIIDSIRTVLPKDEHQIDIDNMGDETKIPASTMIGRATKSKRPTATPMYRQRSLSLSALDAYEHTNTPPPFLAEVPSLKGFKP